MTWVTEPAFQSVEKTVLDEYANFRGSHGTGSLLSLVPLRVRGSKIAFLWYFLGPKFFLVGIS